MIELTNIELFKSLSRVEFDNAIIDLHNDYVCTSMQYSADKGIFDLFFRAERSNVVLQFKGAVVTKFGLVLKRTEDSCILNNFYRGRFEVNGELLEYSPLGERYYYMEFEEGDVFEILAQEVLLSLKS